MPKIRQAIAVLAVAASCIVFNAYRYPVVREMVATLSQPPQAANPKPADATPAEKTADPDKSRDDAVVQEAPASKHPAGVVCKDGVCTMPLPESPTASLSSPSAKDATPSTPKSTEDKPPTRADSPKSDEPAPNSSSESPDASKAKEAEPTSKSPESSSSKPADDPVQSGSKSPESSPYKPADESVKSEPKSPDAETAMSDTPSVGDARKAPESGSQGSNPYAQMAAKFISSAGSVIASPSNADKPPVAQTGLVPIQRPHSQAKAAASEAKPASGASPESKQETGDKGFRHLPAVDQTPSVETISLTPDQVQAYPVTAAK